MCVCVCCVWHVDQCLFPTSCMYVEPSGCGLEVFVSCGWDWLAAIQSDAQIFGVLPVGLLGLRE